MLPRQLAEISFFQLMFILFQAMKFFFGGFSFSKLALLRVEWNVQVCKLQQYCGI